MMYDNCKGLISPPSGRETDTIVAVGSSSKILSGSEPYHDIDWIGANGDAPPPEIRRSDDIESE